jgi:hypothetical protein
VAVNGRSRDGKEGDSRLDQGFAGARLALHRDRAGSKDPTPETTGEHP